MRLFTIGHSTRILEEFIALLQEYEIQILADVRAWPSSRRFPHFNRTNLENSLAQRGIRYEWLGVELGGYRKEGLGDRSPNTAWKVKGFRNYADYALTETFSQGVQRLSVLAAAQPLALMCAERLYWQCHRRIISDYLKMEGHRVTHIIESGKTKEHELSRMAKIVDGKLTYPAAGRET